MNAVAGLGGTDLVVLAAPVEQNVRLLPEVAEVLEESAAITDVGGTKRDIVRAAGALTASLQTAVHLFSAPLSQAARAFGQLQEKVAQEAPTEA